MTGLHIRTFMHPGCNARTGTTMLPFGTSDERFPNPHELRHPELEFDQTAQHAKELRNQSAELRRQFKRRFA